MSANEKCKHGLLRSECELCQKGIALLRAMVGERGIGRPRVTQTSVPPVATMARRARVAPPSPQAPAEPWKPEPPDGVFRSHDFKMDGHGRIVRIARRRGAI